MKHPSPPPVAHIAPTALLAAPPPQPTDDEPSGGPGWYQSTRDLLRGMTVRELDTPDELMTP